MSDRRFDDAIARIDAVNAGDPNRLVVGGVERPKALGEGEAATEWVRRLRPDASEALLLAARAHHIRRWAVPRATYPDGRAGYLQWRRDLHVAHARDTAEILAACGFDADVIDRVQAIIRKRNLAHDAEVQAFEDALCLVFLETQFDDLARRLSRDKLLDVVRKTAAKMSPAGLAAVAGASLSATAKEAVAAALAQPPPPGN